MNRILSVFVVCVLAATSSASTQSPRPTAAQFVGAWRLVSWEQKLANGTVSSNPRRMGSLMYSDSGRMCGVLMDPGRPSWSGRRPTDAELRAAYDGFVAYCGSYEINLAEGFVVHHVDLEKSPPSVGINRKRWFSFPGTDRLVLRVDAAENPSGLSESVLTWERVKR